jgi:hypothetical protein
MIEDRNSEDKSKAVFRLISRNATFGRRRATPEEMLQEILDQMKDAFERDVLGNTCPLDEDHELMYPSCMKLIKDKAEKYKSTNRAYRQVCLMPMFTLSLVMASRVQSHYTHAGWFKISTLNEMINVYGGVSKWIYCDLPRAI